MGAAGLVTEGVGQLIEGEAAVQDRTYPRLFERSDIILLLAPAADHKSLQARLLGQQFDGRHVFRLGILTPFGVQPWFDHLASGRGLCCSIPDGESVADPDWESQGGHYRVRLENNWIDVPDDAVITEPNRAARAMGMADAC
jgi:hypothetical protein